MEIKTCEEYVLSELQRAQAAAEKAESDRLNLLQSARTEMTRLQGIIDYSNEVIKVLAAFAELKKDEDGNWAIMPKGSKAILTVVDGQAGETFIRLAPIIGDEEARSVFNSMFAAKAKEEESVHPVHPAQPVHEKREHSRQRNKKNEEGQ